MSRRLISLSSDLQQLQDEGYELEVRDGFLLIRHVPYVTPRREVAFGLLATSLELSGDVTAPPTDHTVRFAGEKPCDADGRELNIVAGSSRDVLLDDVVVDHTFSRKPVGTGKYADYYEKVTTYIAILCGPAAQIDPEATARAYVPIEASEDESVFLYEDTASSRAEIQVVMKKLELDRAAIVGLGGTGAYILDLVAKTPVREIHLYDGDPFSQHNAFRSPGAASLEELRERSSKVSYLHEIYSKMRRGIIPHDQFIDEDSVHELRDMNFVFLALDDGEAKRLVVEALEHHNVPFIDVGMGVYEKEGALGGILRTTTSTSSKRNHVWEKKRIPFSDGNVNNDYSRNIQIADLNALNAALAVIKWKKLFGFYHDLECEHFSTYDIDGNHLINEDAPDAD